MSFRFRSEAAVDLLLERNRQDILKAAGRFEYTAADADCPDLTRMTMLTEEVGEVARALQKAPHDGPQSLYKELSQVAAVALAWMEYLKGIENG